MSTTIQIKRSSTASAVPVSGDLAVGELAVNLADKRLFAKQADGTIIELSTNPTDLDAATLRIDGVEITASATELNSLDGLTATTAELNILDGVTATATEINKLDGYTGSTAELNLLDGVTATTAELNFVDGVTSNVQTQLNAKQPLDAQLTDIAGLIPTDGSFIVGNGVNFVAESGNTAIASLGVTATATELNTLDGVTATTTELNYTDGVTSNIQTQLDAMVEKAGDTMTGDLSLGDNVKAKFGASNDLEIFHDGSKSIIKDSGTGNLFIRGDNLVMTDGDGTEFIRTATDSAVTIKHAGNTKLETTSTGVDVTGTVTADGLKIANSTYITQNDGISSNPRMLGMNSAGTTYIGPIDSYRGGSIFYGASPNVTNQFFYTGGIQTMRLTQGGDISFYEDTGTTAKFVWDSSAEGLRIGSQPNTDSGLVVSQDGKDSLVRIGGLGIDNYGFNSQIRLQGRNESGSAYYGDIKFDPDARKLLLTAYHSDGDQLVIDSSGNVGIGTASPSEKLDVSGNVRLVGSSPYLQTLRTSDFYYGRLSADGFSAFTNTNGNAPVIFKTATTERARIDSSGNLLVNRSLQFSNAKVEIQSDSGEAQCLTLNSINTDGNMLEFYKAGSTVGSIGTRSTALYIDGAGSNAGGLDITTGAVLPRKTQALADAGVDLGESGYRFKDLYLSGGVYLGGTGAANKLDDYETGVFTPTVRGISVAGTPTYSFRYGSYVKVGKSVYITMQIEWTNITGSSGYLVFGGLPFNVSSDVDSRYGSFKLGYANNFTWGAGAPFLHTKPNDTLIYIGSSASGGSWLNTPMDTSGSVIISGTYQVA